MTKRDPNRMYWTPLSRSRPEKFLAVVVNQVVRIVCEPDFRLPSDVGGMSFELARVGEGCNEDKWETSRSEHLPELLFTFGGNRPMGRDNLHQEKPSPLLVQKDDVGHLLVFGKLQSEVFKRLLVLVEILLGCVTEVDHLCVRGVDGTE